MSNIGSREIFLTDILRKEQSRVLKWRVRKKLGTNLKGLVERNPKSKSHLGKKGSYDQNQWFQDEEQSYLRKKVKKKLGNYDLGFFRTLDSIHYTKERSVLEHMNLGMNLGKY